MTQVMWSCVIRPTSLLRRWTSMQKKTILTLQIKHIFVKLVQCVRSCSKYTKTLHFVRFCLWLYWPVDRLPFPVGLMSILRPCREVSSKPMLVCYATQAAAICVPTKQVERGWKGRFRAYKSPISTSIASLEESSRLQTNITQTFSKKTRF